jgi:hypothetical protein
MADEVKWFQPGYKPAVTRRPSESRWILQKDGRHVACELRDGGPDFGVEVRLFRDGEFYSGRLCATRELAERHADGLRATLERDGWSVTMTNGYSHGRH